jgi:lipid-A-disaccharide synthase
VKLKWFSLPNLLANKSLVPELLQKEVCAEQIVPLVKERLYQDQSQLDESYRQIHQQIKCDASKQAAKAVIDVLADKA